MTDSSIGIQLVTPLTGTSQGRNESYRDQTAQAAAVEFAQTQQQKEHQDQKPGVPIETHQVDVTV